jgi:hypothetical protein
MEIKNFKIKTEYYFEAFQTKNLEWLNELYSKNIILIDWENNVIGKDNVIKINQSLFKEDFKLQVLDIIQSDNQTINNIFIEIPKHNIAIEVIDILTFNYKTFEIEKIRAYKG